MTDLTTVGIEPGCLTAAEADRVAGTVLAVALRRGWTVEETTEVLAMVGLEDVAAGLGWRPAEGAA